MPNIPTDLKSFNSLVDIVSALRGPDGCPWDKEQTHESLTPFAIEEVYEVVEAIDRNDDLGMKEELGDLLFQVVLHAQLAEERKAFAIEDILVELNTKMIRRHPHVFGNETLTTSEEVLSNWEIIKKKEKAHKMPMDHFDLPAALPALQRAFKIGKKTQKSGFDWDSLNGVRNKVEEELAEVSEAIESKDESKIVEELGDLLFSVAQYVRHLGHEPESCLRLANRKFEKRYFNMLELAKLKNQEFESLSLEEKDNLWKAVKLKELK